MHPASHSLVSPDAWGENRRKVRALIHQDDGYLIGKAKSVYVGKAKNGIHPLLPTGRQMSCHFVQNRALVHVTVSWEDKCHDHNSLPLPPPFPELYIIDYDVI